MWRVVAGLTGVIITLMILGMIAGVLIGKTSEPLTGAWPIPTP